MSAELEFRIAYENVKRFFNARNEAYDRINRDIKRNIESVKKDLDTLKNIPSAVDEHRERIKSKLEEYVNYFNELNEKELVEKYKEFMDKIEISISLSEISKISSEAMDIFENFKYEYENKLNSFEEEKLYREYLIIKLKEMGQDVHIDEDGSIVAVSNDNNIVVNIEKDKILLDVPGKEKKCITSIMKFEKLTKNELEKQNISWHTAEKEKALKKKIEKTKETFNINNLYNKELLNREK